MARSNFRIEQGLEIWDANGTGNNWLISGSGAPTGTTGPTAEAPIGSLYMDQGAEGNLYRKTVDNDLAADWVRFVDESAYTALGIAFDDEDFGTFTGDIISDNVDAKVALQELETELVDTRDNVDDLITLSGVAENASDLGTFSGSTITDANDVKGALQELESGLEAVAGGAYELVNVTAATPTTVSTCFTSNCLGAEWEVVVYETANQANKEFFKMASIHDGEKGPYVDAASFDESASNLLKVGNISGLSYTSILTGSGTGVQTLGLSISATAAVTVEVRRTSIP